jgi:hypothetical protein
MDKAMHDLAMASSDLFGLLLITGMNVSYGEFHLSWLCLSFTRATHDNMD